MTTWGAHRSGVVYFVLGVHAGHPAIKIGMSADPVRRARQHKGRLLAWHMGSGRDENDLNARFATAALGGEWFSPTVELLTHIGTLADGEAPPKLIDTPPIKARSGDDPSATHRRCY